MRAHRRPRFLAKEDLFRIPVVGRALRGAGQIPVSRGTRDRSSLDVAVAALGRGEVIVVYPEGTLTRDPDLWPMKGKSGVGRLALTSRAPVIPLAQWGAQEVLDRYARRPGNVLRRPVQHVRVGPPVDLSDLYERAGKDQHAFCLDVDRAGDIRVLANLAPGEEWLDVLLHEVGHAVYDDHVDRALPWVLRELGQHAVRAELARRRPRGGRPRAGLR